MARADARILDLDQDGREHTADGVNRVMAIEAIAYQSLEGRYLGVELLPETDEHGAGVRWILPRAQRPRN